MGISFKMMRLFLHKLSITNTLFSPLQQTLYAGHIVTLFWSVEHFMYATVQLQQQKGLLYQMLIMDADIG